MSRTLWHFGHQPAFQQFNGIVFISLPWRSSMVSLNAELHDRMGDIQARRAEVSGRSTTSDIGITPWVLADRVRNNTGTRDRMIHGHSSPSIRMIERRIAVPATPPIVSRFSAIRALLRIHHSLFAE